MGPGAPRASLLWDFKLLDMSFRVYEEKIGMISFIRGLDKKSLSRQVYEEKKLNKWPGLAYETAQICQSLGIEDVNLTHKDKNICMKVFLQVCHQKNEEQLRSFARGKYEGNK